MTTLTAVKPPRILYREGYKYQLNQDYTLTLPRVFNRLEAHDITTPFIRLTATGLLTVKYGYAWDGASGPTRDTASAMRASLVHDSLYQLMRMHLLPLGLRSAADDLFYDLLRADGMNRVRAWYWWRAVKRFAKSGAAGEDRPVQVAP